MWRVRLAVVYSVRTSQVIWQRYTPLTLLLGIDFILGQSSYH